MHDVEIGADIVARVLARRGRYHLFDWLDPAKTAFVVIDMQNMFCQPGAPAEVPASRDIVGNINRLSRELRPLGAHIIWIYSATMTSNGRSDWDKFLNTFVAAEVRERTREAMRPDGDGAKLWQDLDVDDADLKIVKNRYSCFTPGSSQLERVLRGLGVENVLIAGTKTNVCCETTARDAMMLDYNVVMVDDCCAALSDREHLATLENMIQQFADVLSGDEVLALMHAQSNE